MSDVDSFIDEVTDEVRRDRLFAFMRKWAWLAVLIVVALVGGTAWNEYQKNNRQAEAQAYGDLLLSALEQDTPAARVDALDQVAPPTGQGHPVQTLLSAAEASAESPTDAAKRLLALAETAEVDQIYRQIAILKAVALPNSGLSVEKRQEMLEGIALGQGIIRLLAEEQLALIDMETAQPDAAITRFKAIVKDAGATNNLRARALQMLVALGVGESNIESDDQVTQNNDN